MKSKLGVLFCLSVMICGCDMRDGIESTYCATNDEVIAGLIIGDLHNATIPEDLVEMFNNGLCPARYEGHEYDCVQFDNNQKACSSCPSGQIRCNEQCVAATTDENCGSCGHVCDEGKTCNDRGECIDKCKNKCDKTDPNVLFVCNTNYEYIRHECMYGCDEEYGACLDDTCKFTCSDESTLQIACVNRDILNRKCFFGCEDNQCLSCVDSCLEDGTLTICNKDLLAEATVTKCANGCDLTTKSCVSCENACTSDHSALMKCNAEDVYAAPVQTACANGCSDDTKDCIICENACSEDGVYQLLCNANDKYAAPTKNLCDYGCANGECIILDSDGDGVVDDDDVCPFNGAITTGVKGETDCSTFDATTGTFSIYAAQNLIDLKKALDNDDHGIDIVRFENDINLGLLNTSNDDEGKCVVKDNLSGMSFSGVTLNGQNHKIVATKKGVRCSISDALFDKLEAARVSNFVIDLDVDGPSARAIFINELTPSFSGAVASIENVVVSGSLITEVTDNTDNGYTQFVPVGGMIASASGIASPMMTIELDVSNSYVDNVRVYAPNASQVGGIFGYASGIKIMNMTKVNHVASVTGKNAVGGLFGHTYEFNNYYEENNANHKMISAIIDEVVGKNNVGGITGDTSSCGNFSVNIGKIKIDADSSSDDNVGGIVGNAQASRFGAFNISNIAAKIDSVESNVTSTGGAVGSSSALNTFVENVYLVVNDITSSGSHTGLVLGSLAIDNRDNSISIKNSHFEVSTLKGTEYVSGGIAQCTAIQNLEMKNVAIRANILGNDNAKISGITNCDVSGATLSLDNVVTTTSRKNGDNYNLNNAFFAVPINGENNTIKGYWYNQGSDQVMPYSNFDKSVLETVFSIVGEFDRNGVSTVVKKCRDGWQATPFSTFKANGNVDAADFPAYIPVVHDIPTKE